MKRKTYLLTLISTPLLAATNAWAQTGSAQSASEGSFFLESLALVVVFACLFATFKVYFAIRGGKVGKGWLWFLFGFGALGAAQSLLFASRLGMLPYWGDGVWIDLLRLVSVMFLFVGVTRFRKLLA